MSIIQNNMAALNAHRQSSINQLKLQSALTQLSSGYRINSAADDAAGLAVSEKMRAEQTALERAMMNAQDGASMAQTAEGALSTAHTMLNRLTELATQAGNGTLDASQRQSLNQEAQDILKELDRISQATNFNGINLLDGSLSSENQVPISGVASSKIADSMVIHKAGFELFDGTNEANATFQVADKSFVLVNEANYDATVAQLTGTDVTAIKVDAANGVSMSAADLEGIAGAISSETGIQFDAVSAGVATKVGSGLAMQVGTSSKPHDSITLSVGNMSSKGLGLSGLSLATQEGATDAISRIKSAIGQVSTARGNLGATQNRLDRTYSSLATTYENITSAESRIRDADMAKKFMEYTKYNILNQVSNSMMAHASMNQQMLLQLLK